MKNFFKSKDVHVFPSSFRGKYSERIIVEGRSVDVKNPFDPESELNSEANLVAPGAIGNLFENYIVGYDTEENTEKLTRLRCVIGGYYFVIDNIGDYIYEDGETYTHGFNIKDKFLCIKLRDAEILSNNNESKTKILDSWDNETQHILDSSEDHNNSDFVGLAIFDNITDVAPNAFLKVLDANGNILNESLLPNIKHGTGSNSLSLGNNSQGASGNYSIAANECIASGENSIAVGNHTVANKSDLTVVGKYNSTSEDGDLFVVGCGNNNDDRQNALKVNANIVTINKPTTINSTENVVGDFSVSTNNTNKFKVTADTGKTEIAGNLEVGSNKFTVNSATGNVTIAGTTNTSGNLTIVDVNNENKFTVDASNGNTTIAGTLSAGDTTINGTESVSGNFSVSSDKFKVESATGNTLVAGTLGISGKATISNELEVTGQSNLKDITAVGTLIIKENSAEDNAEKFKVFASGQTAIYNDSDCKTESPALTVSGGVKIDKSLKVNDTIYASKINIYDGDLTINHDSTSGKTQLFAKDDVEIGNDVNKGLKKLLLDLTYPVGSVYTYSGEKITENEWIWIGGNDPIGSSVTNIDPRNVNQQYQPKCPIKSTLGGLWVQITGRFLLAAGNTTGTIKTYNINDEGGSKDAVVVAHDHGASSNEKSLTTNGTVHEDNINQEKILLSALYTGRGEYGRDIHAVGKDMIDNVWDPRGCIHINSGNKETWVNPGFKMREIQVRPNQWHRPDRVTFNFTHEHKIDKHNHTITVKEKGVKGTDKNMPPYLVVYMWKRVA